MISTYKYASHYQLGKLNSSFASVHKSKVNKSQVKEVLASLSLFGLVWVLLYLI